MTAIPILFYNELLPDEFKPYNKIPSYSTPNLILIGLY